MKRGRAGKSKKVSKNKIFFDNKKLLATSIGLFLVFAIALAFVNIPQNTSITGKPTFELGNVSSIRDLFTTWAGEHMDANIGKYVLWLTMFAFILAGLSFLFPDKKRGMGFLKFLIALGVSFLATAYLVPENVFTIIMSFETMALMLMFVPFAALVLISAMLMAVEKERQLTAGRIVLEILLWIAWCGVLIFRLIRAWLDPARGFMFLVTGGGLILFGIFIASLVILLVNKKFRASLRKIGLEVIKARGESHRAKLAEGRKVLEEAGEGYSYGPA